ncbi:MAG: hypothetical protein ACR2PL_12535 [Dehalococcoidia bacterium]
MPIILLLLLFVVLLFFVISVIHAVFGVVLFLVVAALCAAAAEYFLGHKEGLGETLLIGLIGAALGAILSRLLHLPSLIVIAHLPLVWTIAGSMIVVGLLRLARPDSRSTRSTRWLR